MSEKTRRRLSAQKARWSCYAPLFVLLAAAAVVVALAVPAVAEPGGGSLSDQSGSEQVEPVALDNEVEQGEGEAGDGQTSTAETITETTTQDPEGQTETSEVQPLEVKQLEQSVRNLKTVQGNQTMMLPVTPSADGWVHVSTLSDLLTALADETVSKVYIDSTIQINADDGNVSLNLNHTTVMGNCTLFKVNSGANLSIQETAEETVTGGATEGVRTAVSAEDKRVGKAAEYSVKTDGTAPTLTYYVLETKVADDGVSTVESLATHTVTLYGGLISTKDDPVVNVTTGGTFTLNGGYITNTAASYDNPSGSSRGIYCSGGTLNLAGGYIFGCAASERGGGVYAEDSTVNLTNTVIAGCSTGRNGGGIACRGVSTFNMNGGVISGCQVYAKDLSDAHGEYERRVGGGGIYLAGTWSDSSNSAQNTVATITGGYVTECRFDSNVASPDYNAGGGGILIDRFVKATIQPANGAATCVTGNYSRAGGGGIKLAEQYEDWKAEFHSYLYVLACSDGTAPFVSGNVCALSEGGGINVDAFTYASVTAGYITNNHTLTSEHWGGGGLFVANDATLELTAVVVEKNTAGGFGGGVAGCSTGRIVEIDGNSAAIFGNTATYDPTSPDRLDHLSGTSSAKAEDHTYAAESEVFLDGGYQDFFCALYSQLMDQMLGGGQEVWSGSSDGALAVIPTNGTLASAAVAGFTSGSTAADQAKAEQAAAAFVTGNTSNTHGGGILCNGYLFFGLPGSFEMGSRLQIAANKKLLNKDGASINLMGGEFVFDVYEMTYERTLSSGAYAAPVLGELVSQGTNDANGNVTFNRRLTFKPLSADGPQTAVYWFAIRENPAKSTYVEDPVQGEFAYDQTTYYLRVVVTRVNGGTVATNMTMYNTYISDVRVYNKLPTNSGELGTCLVHETYGNDTDYHGHAVNLGTAHGALTFTNGYIPEAETTDVEVTKVWSGASDEELASASVTVKLVCTASDGTVVVLDSAVPTTVTLSATGGWSYRWTDLPAKRDGASLSYSVMETEVRGVTGFMTTTSSHVDIKSTTSYKATLANALKNGASYALVAGGKYALNQNGGWDRWTTGNVTQVQVTETADIYDLQGFTASCAFTASASNDATLLSGVESGYLQLENSGVLKYTSSVWASGISLDGSGRVMITSGTPSSNNGSKYLLYDSNTGAFTWGDVSRYAVTQASGSLVAGQSYILVADGLQAALYQGNDDYWMPVTASNVGAVSVTSASGSLQASGVTSNYLFTAEKSGSKVLIKGCVGAYLRLGGSYDGSSEVGLWNRNSSGAASAVTLDADGYVKLSWADRKQPDSYLLYDITGCVFTYGDASDVSSAKVRVRAYSIGAPAGTDAGEYVYAYELADPVTTTQLTTSVTITNTKDYQERSLTIKKTDKSTGKPMSNGVAFQIYNTGTDGNRTGEALWFVKTSSGYALSTGDAAGATQSLQPDAKGLIKVTGLSPATYHVVESAKPSGYQDLGPWTVDLTSSSSAAYTLTVENVPDNQGFILPTAGGPGFWTMGGLLAGAVFLACALAVKLHQWRREAA